jgi:proline iminopeptidase
MAETFQRAVRGVTIFERRQGAGPVSVALHGGPGAQHDYLLPAFDALARERTLIYYDQRGGGRSPVGREVPVGWTEHVADLEALRELWGLERLTLLGYSWGGLLALLYATTYPARVARLALVSSAPVWQAGRAEFEQRFAARSNTPELQAARKALRESGLRERDLAAYQRRLFELAVVGYFHDPARVHDLTPFRITDRTQKEVWASLGHYDLRPALRRLRVPALILHGEDDPIPLTTAQSAAEALAGELVVIPACGHVPYVEAFEEFARRLDAFLPKTENLVEGSRIGTAGAPSLGRP